MTNNSMDGFVAAQPSYNPMDRICQRLNNNQSSGQLVSEFTGKSVSGGFVTSGVKVLHDGPRSKVFVSAFHIPNHNDNTVHHFKLDFRKVIRQNQDSLWEYAAFKSIDSSDSINALAHFITEQSSLLGIPIESGRIYQAITAQADITPEDVQQFVLDAISGDKTIISRVA